MNPLPPRDRLGGKLNRHSHAPSAAFRPSCLSSLSRCIISENPQLSSNCGPSGTNGEAEERQYSFLRSSSEMENLYSNKPQRHPNTRLSGFTLNACCKSGELLLITGRSCLEARLKTAREQDEGWEKDARRRAGRIAGLEPCRADVKRRFLPGLSASARLMKTSCSNTAGVGREGEAVIQNGMI